jgi:hypothetical protein
MFPLKKSGEKPTQIRGNTAGTKAQKQAQKSHENTTPNLLYKPGKIHKVQHAALASIPLNKSLMKLSCYPRENGRKIATKMRNGREEMKP